MKKSVLIRCHQEAGVVERYTCPDGCCEGGGYPYERWGIQTVVAGNVGKVHWHYDRKQAREAVIELRNMALEQGVPVRIEKVGKWA